MMKSLRNYGENLIIEQKPDQIFNTCYKKEIL